MAKILFDGDSITDCFRTQDIVEIDFYSKEENLGFGYPIILKSMLKVLTHVEHTYKNNAIAGATTTSLLARIDESAKFKPDFFVLLIGINDCFNKIKTKQGTDDLDFENNYRTILQKMTKANPDIKIIIQTITYNEGKKTDPFLVKEVEGKNEIIKKIAEEFNCMIIDINQLLDKQIKSTKLIDWIYEDGIHYTYNTHMFIADKILPYLV